MDKSLIVEKEGCKLRESGRSCYLFLSQRLGLGIMRRWLGCIFYPGFSQGALKGSSKADWLVISQWIGCNLSRCYATNVISAFIPLLYLSLVCSQLNEAEADWTS